MQKYREINGNDYVKDSRATINETMQSIQSMNSGTAFPTTNLFEGMKCYRTDLKKTYTLTDVENGTWVEDAHATLADTATKLQTPRTLSLTGKAAGSATFDGSANASINVTSVNADTAVADSNGVNIAANYVKKSVRLTTENLNDIHTPGLYFCDMDVNATTARNYPMGKASAVIVTKDGANGDDSCTQLCMPYVGNGIYKRQYEPVSSKWSTWRSVAFTDSNVASASKLATPRAISLTGNASGSANFDGTSDVSIDVSVSQAAHADKATQDTNGRAFTDTNAYMHISALANNTDFNNVKTTGIYYCTGNTYSNRPHNSWGILTVYSIGTVKQEYRPDIVAVYYTREYSNGKWTEWSKVNAANADSATNADTVDGIHAASLFYDKGNWDADNWGTIGAYEVRDNQPISDAYTWGQVISSSTNEARFQLYASHAYGGTGRLHYRTGWDNDKSQPWNTILDSENYNLFAPTKTGSGASGTWGINITGNAATATTANALNGIINREPATNNHAIIPGADNRDYCEFHEFGAVWNFIKTSNEGSKTVASIRSDGFHGNVVGNAASATNADTVDGYHASDIINRISAANNGIVTASLTENGYAKFANGLILQWGSKQGNASRGEDKWYNCAFPIAFSAVLTVIDGHKSDNINNITNTGFDMLITWNHTGRYIAIGI